MSSSTSGQTIQSSTVTDHNHILKKRKRSESPVSPSKADLLETFIRLLPRMPSDIQEEIQKVWERQQTVQISSLTMENAIERFSLNREAYIGQQSSKLWEIEKEIPGDLLGIATIPPRLLKTFQSKYMHTADRHSEAICRTLIDVIIIECIFLYYITMDKATAIFEDANEVLARFQKSQKFHLQLVGEAAIEYENETMDTVYRGRIDHCIAIEATGRRSQSQKAPPDSTSAEATSRAGLRRPLFSVLAVVQAKHDGTIYEAAGQLVGYLGVLHKSRKRKKRADASAVGIATQGLQWAIYKITHEGTVMSAPFIDARSKKGLAELVQVIVHVLTESVKSSTPAGSPAEGGLEPDTVFTEDPPIIEEGEVEDEEEGEED
ncbi:hypothetical protein TWF696_001949 [Orbilia brochopaga]|uniref:Uncharacterized protein n=1 Tax=Orbilia brochopaga TaxID=3140254 RepID=A0AAV9U9B9_9PEZI